MMQPIEDEETIVVDAVWMTVAEVAKLLSVNEETVRRWVRSGDLPVMRLGADVRSGYRIRRDDVDKFIKDRYGPAKTD